MDGGRLYLKLEVVPYHERYRAQVLEIAHEMHEASIFRDMEFDDDKVIAQLSGMTNKPGAYFKLAARGDRLYGGLAGSISRMFFCDQLMARDMGWWVRKESRGSAAALLLLADFETWCRVNGCMKIMLGQSSGIDIDVTTKLYEHCGYEIVGRNTVKKLKE